jgi:hypothetical protein
MNALTETAITMTEAAYDLQVADDEWFRSVMTAGLPLIDHGLGVAGLVGVKPLTPGPIDVTEMHIASGPPDFPMRHMSAMSEFPPEQLHQETAHGNVSTMSEQTAANPWMLEAMTSWGSVRLRLAPDHRPPAAAIHDFDQEREKRSNRGRVIREARHGIRS